MTCVCACSRSSTLKRVSGNPTLKPVHFFQAVTQLGHLDGLANIFRALAYPLSDLAGQLRVLARLAGDDLLGYLEELLPAASLVLFDAGRETIHVFFRWFDLLGGRMASLGGKDLMDAESPRIRGPHPEYQPS